MVQKKIFYTFFCFIVCLAAHAQKLPNIQQSSLRAPAHIKIDGDPSEWDNEFQAYNNATNVFYTMANDDENLYLVVQTNNPTIISRIVGQGITLSVQQGNIKDNKNRANVTYPITSPHYSPYFNLSRKRNTIEDTTLKAANSLMMHNNKLIDDSCKFIRISGIPGVDTLISVYNHDGIKARAQFNNKKVFTCEFSIKLKLLNISSDQGVRIAYHISVNGMKPMVFQPGAPIVKSVEPGHEAEDERQTAILLASLAKLSAPTYFDGEYILAKK